MQSTLIQGHIHTPAAPLISFRINWDLQTGTIRKLDDEGDIVEETKGGVFPRSRYFEIAPAGKFR